LLRIGVGCWLDVERIVLPAQRERRALTMPRRGIIDERQCSPVSGLPLGCCRIRSTLIMRGR
jgi:hypothetical protein